MGSMVFSKLIGYDIVKFIQLHRVSVVYTFSKFCLNTFTKELTYSGNSVELTKQNYELLLFFLQRKGRLASKDEIIKNVWKQRVVAENTVDKSFTKLKKILCKHKKRDYFESKYGIGIRFLPKVQVDKKPTNHNYKNSLMPIVLMLMLTSFGYQLFKNNQIVTPVEITEKLKLKKSLLLVMPSVNDDNSHWWSVNNKELFEQVLSQSGNILFKDYQDKPENLSSDQYLQVQWRISPQLKVLTTSMTKSAEEYTLSLKLIDNKQEITTKVITDIDFNQVINLASQWLAKQMGVVFYKDAFVNVFKDQNQTEMYLRGLLNQRKGNHQKAAQYFNLCLSEDKTFHPAGYQLAATKHRMGQHDIALSIVDGPLNQKLSPEMEIKLHALKGEILVKQGHLSQAKKVYQTVLKKHQIYNHYELNNIGLKLSEVHIGLSENNGALAILNQLLAGLTSNQEPELISDVYLRKANIYQKLGQTQSALEAVHHAQLLFNQLGDINSNAKAHILLARIAQNDANYFETVKQLNKSLTIVRGLKNKLVTAETLSQLIGVLLTHGKFDEAGALIREMLDISQDISHPYFKLNALEYAIGMASVKKHWEKADTYLDEHLTIAIETNDMQAQIHNKLLRVENLFGKNQTPLIKPVLDELKQYISEQSNSKLQRVINIKWAKYYALVNQRPRAISLLKNILEGVKDTGIIIEINNLLATYYIDEQLPMKAIKLLLKSEQYQPFAYPYYLLKSKANFNSGDVVKALDYANKCKHKSNQFWQASDEKYLKELIKTMNKRV